MDKKLIAHVKGRSHGHNTIQKQHNRLAKWLRAEVTGFRDQVPERCLVLALGVLKILSASVCLCSIVAGGCGVSVCFVSVYVSPWVCVLALCMPRSVYARVRLLP